MKKTLLRAAVSIALIAWILRGTDLREVWAAVRTADVRFILLAIALIPLGYLSSVMRWRILLRAQGGDAALPFLFRSLMTGIFFNNFLPSTIGGDAIRAWDTARSGVGKATALTIILVDRFVGLLALLVFATAGLLGAGRLTERVPDLALWVLGVGAVMVVVAVVLFLPRHSRESPAHFPASVPPPDLTPDPSPISHPSNRERGAPAHPGSTNRAVASLPPLPGAGWEMGEGGRGGEVGRGKASGTRKLSLARLTSALFAFRGHTRALAGAFFWSLSLQTLVVLNAWVLAQALHIELGLAPFFLIVPLAVFLMMVPVSINGIGVRENLFIFFLAAFGVAEATGLAFAWLDYGLVLLQALVGGLVYAAGRERVVRRVETAEAAP